MAASPREVELKLHVAPEDLPRLEDHPRLRALARGPARKQALASVYFDTSGHDLARSGLELRVRSAGRLRVQTVKSRAPSRAGLFVREEVEVPVPDGRPHPERLPDLALRRTLAEVVAGRALEPVFETQVARTTLALRQGPRELLLALDVGEVRAPVGSIPICELELELERGDPSFAYQLALELLDDVALWPASASKAELGWALVTGETPAPRKAQPLSLEPDATVEDVLAAVVAAGLEQMAANQQPALEGRDPEGVHQLRVAARRLRSALGLFREALPPEQVSVLRTGLRWLGAELGPARDLDVFLEEGLGPVGLAHPTLPGLARLHEEAGRARTDAQARARAALRSRRYTRLVLQLGYWLARRAWREQPLGEEAARLFQPARTFACERLERRQRKALRLGLDLEHASAEAKHRLRIQLKKLRYDSEAFHPLFPGKRGARYIRRMSRLQDVLGELNDVATQERLLDEVLARIDKEEGPDPVRAAGFVAGWRAHRAQTRLARLGRRWRAFEEATPFWRKG